MKVLKTAGQITVHQVAAKGFNMGRKGVGRDGMSKGKALIGDVKRNFKRFTDEIPSNSKLSVTCKKC